MGGGGEGIGKKGERCGKCTSNIIHILINDYIHARLGIFVRRYVGDGEGFRHYVDTWQWLPRRCSVA